MHLRCIINISTNKLIRETLYNQKVIQNFFWKDEYNYPGLRNCPWHVNIQAQACLYLSFFSPCIRLGIIWDFFIQYFQQKYIHMQIQYKNNYAKYAAFMLELIVQVFFLWKRRWHNTPPVQGRRIYFKLESLTKMILFLPIFYLCLYTEM